MEQYGISNNRNFFGIEREKMPNTKGYGIKKNIHYFQVCAKKTQIDFFYFTTTLRVQGFYSAGWFNDCVVANPM
jgi:hypothetical protein